MVLDVKKLLLVVGNYSEAEEGGRKPHGGAQRVNSPFLPVLASSKHAECHQPHRCLSCLPSPGPTPLQRVDH